MERERLVARTKDVIAQQLGIHPDELKDHTHLQNDLGADSLDAVEIVMELEEEFDVNISDSEVEKHQTVKAIIDGLAKVVS